MAAERDALRDWHRLFGLLLTDLFTGSPFIVEVERDLSQQQQLLDVVIIRRGRGRFTGRLPDGLAPLAAHNLITFKSHRETLDSWAMKELLGHSVAYRKLVSPSPSELLPEERFRLYAIAARFPQKLSGQVPWRQRQPGVYDCQWGTDTVRVLVAGELPCAEHNAPLHLFSAKPELVGYGSSRYERHSEQTSGLLVQLFTRFAAEGVVMAYTMADFRRDFVKEHFPELTAEERRELLQSLPRQDWRALLEALPAEDRRELLTSFPVEDRRELLASFPVEDRRELLASLPLDERFAGLSAEQIQQYLDGLSRRGTSAPRKPRRHR